MAFVSEFIWMRRGVAEPLGYKESCQIIPVPVLMYMEFTVAEVQRASLAHWE